MNESLSQFEETLANWISQIAAADAAHDPEHIRRVVKNTRSLLAHHKEADAEVVIAAAWLHDCVAVAKDSLQRSGASKLAAHAAGSFLKSINFPPTKIAAVEHAIEAHSFSANIEPVTIEAKIVQDADRLDALGAIGISRCFLVAGSLGRPLYSAEDPFCDSRPPDDAKFSVDHFFAKLFKITKTLKTEAGQLEGAARYETMQGFLAALRRELDTRGINAG